MPTKKRRTQAQLKESRNHAYQLVKKGGSRKTVIAFIADHYGIQSRNAREDYEWARKKIEAETAVIEEEFIAEILQLFREGAMGRDTVQKHFARKKQGHILPPEQVSRLYDIAWERTKSTTSTDRIPQKFVAMGRYTNIIIKHNRSVIAITKNIAELNAIYQNLKDGTTKFYFKLKDGSKVPDKKSVISEMHRIQVSMANMQAQIVKTNGEVANIQDKLTTLLGLATPKEKNDFAKILKKIEGLSVKEQEEALIRAAIAKGIETGTVKEALQIIDSKNYGKINETDININVQQEMADDIEDKMKDADTEQLLGIVRMLEKVG